jgi:hypothetical protein
MSATATPRVNLIDRSLYASLVREPAQLTIDKDFHPDVQKGLHFLAAMVGVAEGVSPEARDQSAKVFFAVRKLARNATGEQREWPWCVKGVSAISHTGEVIAIFPREGAWLRPTEALTLNDGEDFFLVFNDIVPTPEAQPAVPASADMPF